MTCSGKYLCLFGTRAWPGSPCAHSPGHTGPASPPLPHTSLQTHAYSLQHNIYTHIRTDKHHTHITKYTPNTCKRHTYSDNDAPTRLRANRTTKKRPSCSCPFTQHSMFGFTANGFYNYEEAFPLQLVCSLVTFVFSNVSSAH